MTNEPYKIKLQDIFEGPMDLLVHLIKKNEVDIYDIPIAFITDQFLDYLEWMKSLDVDIAGDFLVMAATLTHLKSRMLLPSRHGDPDTEEGDDPRKELAGPLLEYMQMKSVAEKLAAQPMLDEDVFTRKVDKSNLVPHPEEETIQADIISLFNAYSSLLDKMADQSGLHITFEKISVKEKMTEIFDRIKEKGAIAFDALLSENTDRTEIIVTFLAILEIVKLNMVRLMQCGPYSSLRLIYRESADESLGN
ncbi:MAG TPA: segregation/condensation protein A [Desulfosalsimonadaceae bacterium]|nr:segregation/condensation protein A [Desulfosalsimonadaceae bacterium]